MNFPLSRSLSQYSVSIDVLEFKLGVLLKKVAKSVPIIAVFVAMCLTGCTINIALPQMLKKVNYVGSFISEPKKPHTFAC